MGTEVDPATWTTSLLSYTDQVLDVRAIDRRREHVFFEPSLLRNAGPWRRTSRRSWSASWSARGPFVEVRVHNEPGKTTGIDAAQILGAEKAFDPLKTKQIRRCYGPIQCAPNKSSASVACSSARTPPDQPA